MSADKSGVEGGAINSRRCVRGMWGSMGRIGMAFGGRKRLGEAECDDRGFDAGLRVGSRF